MPLDGWDHVELWVGNAKQAAFWYERGLGFRRMQQVVERQDTPAVRGMIAKVHHLVEVQE